MEICKLGITHELLAEPIILVTAIEFQMRRGEEPFQKFRKLDYSLGCVGVW